VKVVTQVKLLPTPDQAAALEQTLRACNTAASDVAEVARNTGVYRNYDLRKHVYQDIKGDHRLGAQAAQHVIRKACDSYRTLKANIRAGNLGKPGSKRRRRAETNPISFRWAGS
jgi:putative transposase